ncbi:MAG: MBL fold metallo-hydrolase [Planctomycetes bacterium]|nr:MBL fold metallo-hydrolase [Planctomycetota bacterium]
MPDAPLVVLRLKLGPMDNFVYVVGDPDSREAAVVDPAWDVPAILAEAKRAGLRIVEALLTHHHHDHSNGLEPLVRETGARVRVHPADASRLRLGRQVSSSVGEGPPLRLGARDVRVLDTPGHTAGSRCYLVEGNLFSGDTLFVGACGRCDLDDSSPPAMHASLRNVLGSLPDETIVHPGHDYDEVPTAPLGVIRQRNRAMGFSDAAAFEAYVIGPRWPEADAEN